MLQIAQMLLLIHLAILQWIIEINGDEIFILARGCRNNRA